jgi:hypothetical protein
MHNNKTLKEENERLRAEAHASSLFKRGAEFHEWSIARDSFIEGHNHLIKNKPELKLQNHVQEIGK